MYLSRVKKKSAPDPQTPFTATLETFDSRLWQFHIMVPAAIAALLIEGDDRRVVCTINGSETFQCALMPRGGDYFILVNKQHRVKLGLKLGNTMSVQLEKDRSEYGLPMPEEFKELMAQDPEMAEIFEALTAGKQRTLLYIIDKPKGPDIRLRNAIAIARHLVETGGKINFTALNNSIKRSA